MAYGLKASSCNPLILANFWKSLDQMLDLQIWQFYILKW